MDRPARSREESFGSRESGAERFLAEMCRCCWGRKHRAGRNDEVGRAKLLALVRRDLLNADAMLPSKSQQTASKGKEGVCKRTGEHNGSHRSI